VPLSGPNRLLWSARTDDFNLLVSDQVQNRTHLLFRRDVQSRITAIAPFLQLDDAPYVVVVGGHIYWIQDAYVTAGTYPYSQQEPLAGDGVNYLRNSVKAVVDAYEGTIDFYISDPSDPIIRAYAATFPGLFKPLRQMPAQLQAHIRVPAHQFAVQSAVYGTYHISDQDPSFFTTARTRGTSPSISLTMSKSGCRARRRPNTCRSCPTRPTRNRTWSPGWPYAMTPATTAR
jgi:uncharacterized membrane protein (UPF0182 family)